MLQTSLLLTKSLNKTETPIFLSVVCSLFPRSILLPFIVIVDPLVFPLTFYFIREKKGKIKVQGVPQSQTAVLPRPQEEEETDKTKLAQTEKTYEKH